MVENYNKIIHDDDYEDPEMLRKMGYHQSPLKSASKLNRESSKKRTLGYEMRSSLSPMKSVTKKINNAPLSL